MALCTICIYGDSARGKTTALKYTLEWARKNLDPKARMRVVTREHSDTLNKQKKDGSVEVWRIDDRDNPYEVTSKAVNGYMPADINDPASKLVQAKPSPFLIHAYEGLDSIAGYLGAGYVTGGLAQRSGANKKIGPAEETISFKDGTVSVGGHPRTHYNVIQTWIEGLVQVSLRHPGIVVWTAHERKATSEEGGTIAGPEVFGKAATPAVPGWFGNVLHLTLHPSKKVEEAPEFRMWLKTHYAKNPVGVPFAAKIAVDDTYAEQVPTYLSGGARRIGEVLDMVLNEKFPALEKAK